MAARFGKISFTLPNLSTNHSSRKPFSINTRVLLLKSYPEPLQDHSTSGRPLEKKTLQSNALPSYCSSLNKHFSARGTVLHYPSPVSGRRPIMFGEWGALLRTVQYLVDDGLQLSRPLGVRSPIWHSFEGRIEINDFYCLFVCLQFYLILARKTETPGCKTYKDWFWEAGNDRSEFSLFLIISKCGLTGKPSLGKQPWQGLERFKNKSRLWAACYHVKTSILL